MFKKSANNGRHHSVQITFEDLVTIPNAHLKIVFEEEDICQKNNLILKILVNIP